MIKHLTENFPIKNSSTERSIGDDAAIINPEGKKVVITSDVLEQKEHFNLGYVPLKHLGYKAVVVNLSDIAAMNAVPTQILVSMRFLTDFLWKLLMKFTMEFTELAKNTM